MSKIHKQCNSCGGGCGGGYNGKPCKNKARIKQSKNLNEVAVHAMELIKTLSGDIEQNEKLLNAIDKELDDVEYKGSYVDGIKALKARIRYLEHERIKVT